LGTAAACDQSVPHSRRRSIQRDTCPAPLAYFASRTFARHAS
jgi:hypothetical protein